MRNKAENINRYFPCRRSCETVESGLNYLGLGWCSGERPCDETIIGNHVISSVHLLFLLYRGGS